MKKEIPRIYKLNVNQKKELKSQIPHYTRASGKQLVVWFWLRNGK